MAKKRMADLIDIVTCRKKSESIRLAALESIEDPDEPIELRNLAVDFIDAAYFARKDGRIDLYRELLYRIEMCHDKADETDYRWSVSDSVYFGVAR